MAHVTYSGTTGIKGSDRRFSVLVRGGEARLGWMHDGQQYEAVYRLFDRQGAALEGVLGRWGAVTPSVGGSRRRLIPPRLDLDEHRQDGRGRNGVLHHPREVGGEGLPALLTAGALEAGAPRDLLALLAKHEEEWTEATDRLSGWLRVSDMRLRKQRWERAIREAILLEAAQDPNRCELATLADAYRVGLQVAPSAWDAGRVFVLDRTGMPSLHAAVDAFALALPEGCNGVERILVQWAFTGVGDVAT